MFIYVFWKNSNPKLLIGVMLCFGGKSCFLTKKSKVGNEESKTKRS